MTKDKSQHVSEEKLQHNIVKWHQNEYPERKEMLFEVNNDTHSVKQAMHRRAMGMQSGAADLMIVADGRVGAIEIKSPGSTHNADHIRNQIGWGTIFAKNQGWYLISQHEDKIKDFIIAVIDGKDDTLADLCNEGFHHVHSELMKNKKTVRF